jgi:hypothetical protein
MARCTAHESGYRARRTDREGSLKCADVCACSVKPIWPDAAKWLLCIVTNLHLVLFFFAVSEYISTST